MGIVVRRSEQGDDKDTPFDLLTFRQNTLPKRPIPQGLSFNTERSVLNPQTESILRKLLQTLPTCYIPSFSTFPDLMISKFISTDRSN